MTLVEQPYKHYLKENFFEPTALQFVNEFLSNCNWSFFEDENFPQFISERKQVEDFFVLNSNTKEQFSFLLDSSFIQQLENLFPTALKECVSISFHKMTAGCFNVVHNDHNSNGEQLRIVCYLTDPTNYEGGELQLFSLSNQSSSVTSYKLNTNTAFIFSMTENALHSVSEVLSGERVCLVITYK